jgi:fructose-specific phosphotransferase system IIC component
VLPKSYCSSQWMLGRCTLTGGCFAIIYIGGCFATVVAPLSRMLCCVVSGGCFAVVVAHLLRMLCRVVFGGCFAIVLVVRTDALPPYLSLLGGSFATAASSPQLAVLVIPCRSSSFGCGGGPYLSSMVLSLVYFVLNHFLCGSCAALWVFP